MEQVFSDAERRVFRYFNGAAEAYGDPVRVYRRLLTALGGDLDVVLEHTRHPSVEVSGPALERLADAARFAFDLAPFDPATGAGATEPDCLAAVESWAAWMRAKKGRAAS